MPKQPMDPNKQRYLQQVQRLQPKRNLALGMLRAFWVGGVICTIGQCILLFGKNCLQLDEKLSAALVSITMVFLGALVTGIGVYDRIGTYAGAGSLVPISGFSNAITSCAMEFKHEGFVLGVGARMFTVAGPVLVYGITASVVYGLIYWITTLF